MKKPEKSKLTEGVKITRDFDKTVLILKAGGVVIFPTDTVYGIGCRFDDIKAIDRIYQIKGAPKDQPFPILVSSVDQVKKLAKMPEIAQKLIKKYWPGGLTIILESISQNQKIGFRIPNSKLVLDLINTVGVPIIGTSANFHDQKPPTNFNKLDPKFIKQADFVIKGKCQKRIESTVIDATFDPPKIIRQGAVTIDDFKN